MALEHLSLQSCPVSRLDHHAERYFQCRWLGQFHQRPDVVPGVNQILGGNPANGYINPLAFATLAGNFGNLGRDAVYGPGFWKY
jgi:hypothetical protein